MTTIIYSYPIPEEEAGIFSEASKRQHWLHPLHEKGLRVFGDLQEALNL
jgi:hypothetical protein